MKINLTPRLQKIAELVPPNSKVADIGTDHGHISIYLLQSGRAKHIIASDVNKGPLESARKNIAEFGFEKDIELRLGSGLEVLQANEVDTVIIAGMGGILISQLLQATPIVTDSISTFILQPMQAQQELRRFLVSNEYKIIQDILVKEDLRIYEIIVAERGKQIVEDEILYEVGFHLKSNPKDLAEEFILRKIHGQREIIENLTGQNSPTVVKKYQDCLKKVAKLEEVLRWLQS